jgi:hypothetical protein
VLFVKRKKKCACCKIMVNASDIMLQWWGAMDARRKQRGAKKRRRACGCLQRQWCIRAWRCVNEQRARWRPIDQLS